jgi:hypothetical protein
LKGNAKAGHHKNKSQKVSGDYRPLNLQGARLHRASGFLLQAKPDAAKIRTKK